MPQEGDNAVTVPRYATKTKRPTVAQKAWLQRGLDQPGGKLPLFDSFGQHYDNRTIRACIEQGWAEPWFNNTLKPDWMVCKLTPLGRAAVSGKKRRAKKKGTSATSV